MKVGIQLYSVKTRMKGDPVGTIGIVAGMGYKYIEGANHNAANDPGVGFPAQAEELRAEVEKYGSRFISAHIFPFNADSSDQVMEFHKKLGTEFIVNPASFFSGREDTLRKCEEFNKAGSVCKKHGMSFCYHNHYHEYQKIDGDKTVMDLILENTDPELVGIELDTYWALRGGFDPVRLIKSYGPRIKMLHQKDMPREMNEPVNVFETMPEGTQITLANFDKTFSRETVVEIGTGCMDIQSIIDAANAVPSIRYIVLEQDRTSLDEFESIRVSMDAFRKFQGISWD